LVGLCCAAEPIVSNGDFETSAQTDKSPGQAKRPISICPGSEEVRFLLGGKSTHRSATIPTPWIPAVAGLSGDGNLPLLRWGGVLGSGGELATTVVDPCGVEELK
jgi:hypothetical protein